MKRLRSRKYMASLVLSVLMTCVVWMITIPLTTSGAFHLMVLSFIIRINVYVLTNSVLDHFTTVHITGMERREYFTTLMEKIKECEGGNGPAFEFIDNARKVCSSCNKCFKFHFKLNFVTHFGSTVIILVFVALLTIGTDVILVGCLLGVPISILAMYCASRIFASTMRDRMFMDEVLDGIKKRGVPQG